MKKAAKIFLLISVSSLAISMTGPGSEIFYGGLKPIGAVAFVAFFICNILGKEFELHDQEEQAKAKPTRKPDERKGNGVLQHA